MSFLKGLVGPGVLPSAQETQAPTNAHVASTAPKMGGTGDANVFCRYGVNAELKISWTQLNTGRRFFCCKNTKSTRLITISIFVGVAHLKTAGVTTLSPVVPGCIQETKLSV
uniref:Uncharacterized protein n=1 Tax=Solanum tuberosum TaxID=4113 RepID=M1BHG1_SOLTU